MRRDPPSNEACSLSALNRNSRRAALRYYPLYREVPMLDARRFFLKDFAAISGGLLLFQGCPPIPEPRRRTPVDPPEPAEKQTPAASDPNVIVVQRHTQEKQLRQTLEELFIRVRDLKDELDHTPTANVFSVDIFKRTQEIEKLAKHLKTYAKL
jgi:hypothetical protein